MDGRAKLRQTAGECSQTISSRQLCFKISKSCPVSAQRPPTDGPLPKRVEKFCFSQKNLIGDTKLKKLDVFF